MILWWAQKDSNLQPKDYEFVVNAPCLGKSSAGQCKQQNKKVSCERSLAQLGEDRQNSALYRMSTAPMYCRKGSAQPAKGQGLGCTGIMRHEASVRSTQRLHLLAITLPLGTDQTHGAVPFRMLKDIGRGNALHRQTQSSPPRPMLDVPWPKTAASQ